MATRASLSQKPAKGTPQPSAGSYQAWSGKGMATPGVTRRQALDDDNSEQRREFSYPSRAATTRAAPGSSHSSGTESGRERRRKGKLKMKQQLDAALLRVSALEERNRCLLAIVAQLTPTDATAESSPGHSRPAAIFFDLFNDHVADAETQTDISVDLTKPDIFMYLSQQGLECPQQSRAADTACADAAAGADLICMQREDTAVPRLEASTSRDTRRQALDDVNPEQRRECEQVSNDAISADFNSQELAFQGELLHIRPSTTQPGAGSYQAWSGKGMATPSEKRRQALDDDNSEQRRGFAQVFKDAISDDFNSQELAYQCEPLPIGPSELDNQRQPGADSYQAWSGKGMATPGGLHELLNHTSCSGTAAHDTSQDLVKQVLKLGCGPLPQTESVAHDSEADTPLATRRRQALEDVNSEQRCPSGQFEQILQDFNSQNLAHRCEPLPTTAEPTEHASPVLLDANADVLTVGRANGSNDHRVKDEQSLKDFISHQHAHKGEALSVAQAIAEIGQSDFNSQHLANTCESLSDHRSYTASAIGGSQEQLGVNSQDLTTPSNRHDTARLDHNQQSDDTEIQRSVSRDTDIQRSVSREVVSHVTTQAITENGQSDFNSQNLANTSELFSASSTGQSAEAFGKEKDVTAETIIQRCFRLVPHTRSMPSYPIWQNMDDSDRSGWCEQILILEGHAAVAESLTVSDDVSADIVTADFNSPHLANVDGPLPSHGSTDAPLVGTASGNFQEIANTASCSLEFTERVQNVLKMHTKEVRRKRGKSLKTILQETSACLAQLAITYGCSLAEVKERIIGCDDRLAELLQL